MNAINSLEELEDLARTTLPKPVFDFYSAGSESESTLRANRDAFSQYKLLPRVLVDVTSVDTSCQLLGRRLSLPVLVAPTALHCMAHPEGELATARGAAAAGSAMVVSTNATCSIEEIASTQAPFLMFQLYVWRNRTEVQKLVQDAERLGYAALVLTVDCPRAGKREADVRNKFAVPPGLRAKNYDRLMAVQRDAARLQAAAAQPAKFLDSPYHTMHSSTVDQGLTWSILPWLKSVTRLPVFIKGILSPADAALALRHGADGIMVSNHGGRQVDHSPAALDALAGVAAVVRGRVPLLLDGGVRRGTDVLKALALGADAVMIGRPVLYGLAVAGQQGVQQVFETLRSELELSMALCGCTKLADVNRDLVLVPQNSVASQLQQLASRL